MKVVAITGTPGTGKTYLSKILAKKLGFYYVDIPKLGNSIYAGYDKSRRVKIVDTNKMVIAFKRLYNHAKNQNYKGIIFDSHLSHYLPRKLVELCIVLICDIKKLKRILEKRGYTSKKIRENLDAEIFEICYNEAIEKGHKVLKIDTTTLNKKSLSKIVNKVLKAVF